MDSRTGPLPQLTKDIPVKNPCVTSAEAALLRSLDLAVRKGDREQLSVAKVSQRGHIREEDDNSRTVDDSFLYDNDP